MILYSKHVNRDCDYNSSRLIINASAHLDGHDGNDPESTITFLWM